MTSDAVAELLAKLAPRGWSTERVPPASGWTVEVLATAPAQRRGRPRPGRGWAAGRASIALRWRLSAELEATPMTGVPEMTDRTAARWEDRAWQALVRLGL